MPPAQAASFVKSHFAPANVGAFVMSKNNYVPKHPTQIIPYFETHIAQCIAQCEKYQSYNFYVIFNPGRAPQTTILTTLLWLAAIEVTIERTRTAPQKIGT